MKKKSVKIMCGVLIVAIILIIGFVLKNPPYLSRGECCFEISPLDSPLYDCHTEGEGSICVSEKFNETCACVSGACVCN